MGQALYRKYRSKTLSEIVGQEHITDTLAHAIETGRLSHAYLFTGPRGVGKTSIARILAHQLNDVTYTGEDTHLDIIEIDAASTGGVDEIRDLREKAHLAPAGGKYKVYIIDEVHMMTTAAFNALLKTLEEPPAHVIFILATTEAHKVPATILSRTQRFTFKPIPEAKVIKHLRHIATTEKIDIADDALALIAEHGGGSFRDSISMLDQASSLHAHLDRTAIEELLGIPSTAAIQQLVEALAQNHTSDLITTLAALRSSGYQAAAISKQLSQALRAQLLDGPTLRDQPKILTLLERLIDIPPSHNPDQLLELVLLQSIIESNPQPTAAPAATAHPSAKKPAPSSDGPKAPPSKAAVAAPPHLTTSAHAAAQLPDTPNSDAPSIDAAQWTAVLDALKKQHNTLYGVIKTAQPTFLQGCVELTFNFAFHYKRANDVKNKNTVTNVLQTVTGHPLAVTCRHDKTSAPAAAPAAQKPPAEIPSTPEVPAPPLEAISNIFGGGELLES